MTGTTPTEARAEFLQLITGADHADDGAAGGRWAVLCWDPNTGEASVHDRFEDRVAAERWAARQVVALLDPDFPLPVESHLVRLPS